MRISATAFLLSLFFCGCSLSHDSTTRAALDRVQPGQDISFGDYVLRIEKREGPHLEGVRIVSREPDGQVLTIRANRGTLSQGAERSLISVTLYDAQTEKAEQRAFVDMLTVSFPTSGL